MDQDQIVTKRLHVSGLTPAITQSDLAQRLGTFGTVEALDGFGKLDAVGRPRRFAYVTFKSSKGQLAKCMNLLSGTTWKGTKLRIGEAKPDFHERISHEIETASVERPKKRRRFAGVEASNMSLVTPENVHLRKGWHVTPLGRLIRQMRMRPIRPLPPPITQASSHKKDVDSKKKPKRRFKQALLRARRRTINPLRWGSQHLKGAFLDSRNVIIVERDQKARPALPQPEAQDPSSDEDSDISSESETEAPNTVERSPPAPTTAPDTQIETAPDDQLAAESTNDDDLAREKLKSLSLLESLFGGLDGDQDWGGKESVDSDIDMDAAAPLPAEKAEPEPVEKPKPVPKNPLKELFAPQEEQGFSLLGHLDLEIEEEPIPFAAPKIVPTSIEPVPLPTFTTHHSQITYDPKQPLFFPLSKDARASRGKAKDILDVMKDQGYDWRNGFYRKESSEDITNRWEETKGDLTRDWKKRHREAVKSRKRKGGADGEF